MKLSASIVVAMFGILSGGCAIITSSEMQQLALTARSAGGVTLEGASAPGG